MILATIRIRSVGEMETACLTMIGHAGYRGGGNDIVCASASILMQTLANRLLPMSNGGTVQAGFTDEHGNERTFWARVNGAGGANREALERMREGFAFVQTGLIMLAEGYPENVTVILDGE